MSSQARQITEISIAQSNFSAKIRVSRQKLARAIVARFRCGDSRASSPTEIAARATAALDNYEANIRVVKVLGEAYKFKVLCFRQPSLAYGSKPLVPFEQLLQTDAPGSPDADFKILRAVNEQAARRALQDGGFVFLGQIFDSVSEPLYIDRLMHLGPRETRSWRTR